MQSSELGLRRRLEPSAVVQSTFAGGLTLLFMSLFKLSSAGAEQRGRCELVPGSPGTLSCSRMASLERRQRPRRQRRVGRYAEGLGRGEWDPIGRAGRRTGSEHGLVFAGLMS